MPLAPGARVGSYEVLSSLGVGGMGEVYRARDTRLNRDVAIKVLSEAFALDHDRLARFEREAQLLASLNHSNIGAIYGLAEEQGITALVLEIVEGPTLAERIAAAPLPLDDTLSIARQIADALEAAHDCGVIHRDLKPANIKLTPRGVVKVLDFGLAKAFDPAGSSSGVDPANSPTLSHGATSAGIILGTAAYMSPEQAKGQPVDRRTDIFAFGCVLYEMLTGAQAFHGTTTTEILADVLRGEPDWSRLPAGTPAGVTRLLRRCLHKDRTRRLQAAGDARLELDDAMSDGGPAATATVVPPRRRLRWLLWVALFPFGVVLISLLAVLAQRSRVVAPEAHVNLVTPDTDDLPSLAVSPDGRQIVFAAFNGDRTQLWLRPLDTPVVRPLDGTDGGRFPFWSPDGRSIGFFDSSKLKTLDLARSTVQTLADVAPGFGGAWAADGTIVYAPRLVGPLYRVSSNGGEPSPITTIGPNQIAHVFPHFLPDGRRFIYAAREGATPGALFVGSLDQREATRVTPTDSYGIYLPSGWLLFMRQRALIAQRFDPSTLALTGNPVTVAATVYITPGLPVPAFAAASDVIAYRPGIKTISQLAWFDRSGHPLGTFAAADQTEFADPQLSPDGRRVAVERTVQGNTDIWVGTADRLSRLTFDAAPDTFPVWSPDGTRIAYVSPRTGQPDVYAQTANGGGAAQLILHTPNPKGTSDWSPDGRSIMYLSVINPANGAGLYLTPADGSQKTTTFVETRFAEVWGEYSPDGGWVAYMSDESGRWEIYVRSASTERSGQWQVSTGGGVYARWSRAGNELYYVAPDSRMMAASFTSAGGTPQLGTPVALFPTRIVGGGVNFVGRHHQYAVAPDGRFLMNVTVGEPQASPLALILNWKPGR